MKTNPRGILYYDGTCSFCLGMVERTRGILSAAGAEPRPFESGADEPEMQLHWHDGTVLGGADAAFFLARRTWWLAPLGWSEWIPGVRRIARKLYRRVAKNRHCIGGACRIDLETLP